LSIIPIVKAKESPYADRISIGRARNCDVVLRQRLRSPSSTRTCDKKRTGAGADRSRIAQRDARRGQKAVENEPVKLKSADLITLGSLTVRVVNAESLHRSCSGCDDAVSFVMRVVS